MKAGMRGPVVSFLLLTFLFLLGASALADTTSDGYTYTAGMDGVTITGYTGVDVDLVVPGTIGGQNVIAIGDSAFSGKSALKSISLPDSVLSLGNYAFSNCTTLENLSLGSGLQTIGNFAFARCYALASLSIPDGVTAIGANAFDSDSALTSMELPDQLATVSSELFANCSKLASVTLPVGVTSIGRAAFDECEKLTDITIPTTVTSIAEFAFNNCDSLTSVSVPAGVTHIEQSTFAECGNLTSVDLPDGLTYIGNFAFAECEKLTDCNIPDQVTYIGPMAFSFCRSLQSVQIPSGVTEIYNSAFYYCDSLTEIVIPEGVTRIGQWAFGHCFGLTSITIHGGVMSIGEAAFYDCKSLTNVNIPAGVTSIEWATFYNCSALESIQIPDGVTSIGGQAFAGCSKLVNVNIPARVTSIGDSAFMSCRPAKFVLPRSLTSIGSNAFTRGPLYAYEGSYAEQYRSTSVSKPITMFIHCDKSSFDLELGNAVTLSPTVSYHKPVDRIEWNSGDLEVATIDESGVLTGVALGRTTIIASIAGDDDMTTTFDVVVKKHATGLMLDKGDETIYTGETLNLQATVTPDDATDPSVTWASSNEAVATVADGVVMGLKAGNATITATTEDGSNKRASCEVTVKQYATSLELDKSSVTLYAGRTLTLTPRVLPGDTSDPSVTWASSDESVATVEDGIVTGVKLGSVTITATTADGSDKTASCEVTVKLYASGVSLDRTDASLYPGEALTLKATVSPDNTSYKVLTWKSSDEAVALVSEGVVTALKAGTATITATAADGSGKYATCEITVWTPAAGVVVGPVPEALLKAGDTLTLSAEVQPAGAHDRNVTWSTSNASVARVQGGVVTAVGRGIATITATTHNGKTGTCVVSVEDRVADLELRVEETPVTNGVYDLQVGAKLEVDTIVLPQGIGHFLSYKSTDEKVVSVKSSAVTGLMNGQATITGLKNGQVTITVTAKDSKGLASKSKTLKVNVFTPVGSVALPGEVRMLAETKKRLTATIAPSSASDKALTWDSDNKAVATVSQDGTVTALKTGTANISATSVNGKVGSCLVRVTDRATGVQIATETGKAYVDYKKYLQLTSTVSPGTAYGAVTWKSTNTAYVTVDANGKVYGKKVGKPVTIYATAADGTGVRGSIAIQVITPVRGVNLPETDKVFVGRKKKLSATLSPSNPTFKALTWESNNEAVAMVDESTGLVTAKALGTASITATAYNGQSDSCTVTVAQPVTGITLTPVNGYKVVYKGETASLTETIMPDNANDKGVTWKSSNEKYAKVDNHGQVKGRSAGKVKITATAKDGSGVPGSINLTVAIPATSIKLSKSSAVLYHNGEIDALKTVRLTAAASPKGSVYRSLAWSVESGADVATVDAATGLVTALKDGTTVIRATADRGYTATGTVTVRTLPTTLSLNTTEKTLAFNQSFNLGVEAAFDAGCTEKALTWTSKNKNVATVSSEGVVKASKNRTGTTIITATTKNNIKVTCIVKVVKRLPKGVTGTPTAGITAPRVALRLTGGGYCTSDDHVADVDGSGNVELKADGVATLEAGGKQFGVKVEDVNLAELNLDEGAQLLVTTDEQVWWTVKDEEVAAVGVDGRLTALRKGMTSLTCQAENGGAWAIRLVVTQPNGVEPQPEPEPSEEPEVVLPEPTPWAEPTFAPEPEPSFEPTATQQPTPSMEPESTAKPEPEKNASA